MVEVVLRICCAIIGIKWWQLDVYWHRCLPDSPNKRISFNLHQLAILIPYNSSHNLLDLVISDGFGVIPDLPGWSVDFRSIGFLPLILAVV